MDYVYVPREEKLPWVQDMNHILLEVREEYDGQTWLGIEAAPELEELFRRSEVKKFLQKRCGMNNAMPPHFSFLELGVNEEAIAHDDNNTRGSIVTYLNIPQNMVGGNLIIGNYEIIPRVKDIVYIGPQVKHRVTKIQQKPFSNPINHEYRLSCVINFTEKNSIWE